MNLIIDTPKKLQLATDITWGDYKYVIRDHNVDSNDLKDWANELLESYHRSFGYYGNSDVMSFLFSNFIIRKLGLEKEITTRWVDDEVVGKILETVEV